MEKYLERVLCQINKTIGIICKLQNLLPRTALIKLHKAFVRPHLYSGDILYDLEIRVSSIQCLYCGSLMEKLFQELGFESLQQRRWYRKLCSFYKIFKNESPSYLSNTIPTRNPSYITRNFALRKYAIKKQS